MLKLAITGNIASGKSLIESFFQEEGIITLDTDVVVHNLLAENKDVIDQINNLFDVSVKNEKGIIDRKKVGKIVFNDKNKLRELEKIIHPKVKKLVEEFFENNKNEKIIVVSVPQLYETGWEKLFDRVLLVVANDSVRLDRLLNRNKLSQEEANQRISAQISQEEKIKKADYIIDNSKAVAKTRIQFNEILEKLLGLVFC